jgi:hypothetical protein
MLAAGIKHMQEIKVHSLFSWENEQLNQGRTGVSAGWGWGGELSGRAEHRQIMSIAAHVAAGLTSQRMDSGSILVRAPGSWLDEQRRPAVKYTTGLRSAS